jgi:RNA polymerase sigma-70 factor (ECF subfamily)
VQIELVERARNGDHDAFSALVLASTPRLYGAAYLILRDPDRAQDAVQEALVLAWRHVRALRDAQAWDGWLYRFDRPRVPLAGEVQPAPGHRGAPRRD